MPESAADDRIVVTRNELTYLYYALDAASSDTGLDFDLTFDIIDIGHRATAILARLLGRPELTDPMWRPLGPLPELPAIGTVESNPLLPAPEPPGNTTSDEPEPLTGVVYGLIDRFEGFGFLDIDAADAWVAEVDAINACATLGDFRRLVRDLEYVSSPVDPADDEYPYLPDDHVIDLGQYLDSWPPSTPFYGQELLPATVVDELIEHADAELFCTILDGDFFLVPAAREAEMLAVFARHGLAARRHDGAMDCLG